ncbi:CotH kinase family protein [Luteolibacter luteus]|uniref:LTD domain-containing protein n=1 Tax=Luteolibacter luteus TaxID=2728835 RepID=A0A858RFW2_9BACT|nr:FN3 associated domain-containing protein [Luteolibacter luteus]QJE95481.1 hypothetical protein HHL09_06695 [Luteolibacter luteus]
MLSLLLSGALAQTFNPSDYGNVVLHLKADELNQVNETAVTEWGPLSASGANTPTYIASDARFNGQPVVRFDGGNDVMKRPGANYAARTVFAVVALENEAGSLAGLVSNGSDGLNIRRDGTSVFYRSPGFGMDGNDFVGNGSPTGQLYVNQAPSGSLTYGVPHLVMAVAGEQKLYGNFWLGSASSSLGRYWNGSVAEILVYDGELSPLGIDRVGWYLQKKYSLPTTFPPVFPVLGFTAAAAGITSEGGVLSTPGAAVTLNWTSTGADTLSVDQDVQAPTSLSTGSAVVSPSVTTTYTLSASNSSGASQKTVTVYIGETPQMPVLNEFLASNSGGLRDEDGASEDWIEIYNPNPFAIDVGGYLLEDSANEWAFPEGTIIAASGYRIVFASSKNRTDPAGNLHTNFGVSADGEYLALKSPGGVVATEYAPAFPPQRSNVSYGLAAETRGFFPVPTPAAANGGQVSGLVGDVAFGMPRGFYTSSFQLSLTTDTQGATIRYTTDGSTPTESHGTIYASPIPVNATRTVRARAFLAGSMPSPVATSTYLFVSEVVNGQNDPSGTAPAGWPTSNVNGQNFRYGWNATVKAQYTNQQLSNGLQQIPSISIVTDQGNLTDANNGIYVNASLKGDLWECPASVEYLPADGGASFHVNAGLRIRGGASRGDGYPKHSLRLHFRGEYGASSLNFPIHGEGGADEFDTLDLRTEQNYHYANSNGSQNTAVREVFCRDLIGAMGEPTTRSRYVNLYLNGQYWGLYQTEERAQEDFGASYFGGRPEDYDVIQTSNHPNFTYELSSGQIDAWQTMWMMARAHQANPTNANYFALMGRDANGQRIPSLPVYVDVDHLINYMLLHYYTGDGDGPLSNFLGMNRANNWRGMRDRSGTEGFKFFVHDSEHTLQASSWVDNRATNNTTGGSNRSSFSYSNPEWLHEDLAVNPEYRIRIADMAQKHLFNGGAMTPAVAQAIFDARAAQISQAIVPDIVRWAAPGDNPSLSQWQSQLTSIRNGFFPGRPAAVINQLRSRGFFPSVNAPVFSRRGGQVNPGTVLTLSAGSQTGTIYYTLDGSDPRAIGGTIAGTVYAGPGITLNGLVKVRARFRSNGGEWSALDEAEFVAYPPAGAGDLVVSKIHYHAPDPTPAEEAAGFDSDSDFEYIELMNISSETLDLSAVELETAVTFNFATAAIRILGPGQRVVIAENAAALQFRHGPGIPIAGEFGDDLSNGGETIRLVGAGNTGLRQFAYDDVAPWPVSPDGGGYALVLKNPAANPNHGQGNNWRASTALGGRPGEADMLDPATWQVLNFDAADLAEPAKEVTIWGHDADPDGDGLANIIEMVFDTSPLSASSTQVPAISWWTDPESSARYLTISCLVREEMAGVFLQAEASDDLVTWNDGLPRVGAPVPEGNGMVSITFRDTVPASPGMEPRFVRLKVDAEN